jgi:hypothetical protein
MDNDQLVPTLQAVISPVVFVSGVGMLVLSMTNRFSHASNRMRALAEAWRKSEERRGQITPQIHILNRRLRLLLAAIALGLGSILVTALLIIALFANYLLEAGLRWLIILLFSLSLLALVCSLALFIRDMTLALAALEEELRDILEK